MTRTGSEKCACSSQQSTFEAIPLSFNNKADHVKVLYIRAKATSLLMGSYVIQLNAYIEQ